MESYFSLERTLAHHTSDPLQDPDIIGIRMVPSGRSFVHAPMHHCRGTHRARSWQCLLTRGNHKTGARRARHSRRAAPPKSVSIEKLSYDK